MVVNLQRQLEQAFQFGLQVLNALQFTVAIVTPRPLPTAATVGVKQQSVQFGVH